MSYIETVKEFYKEVAQTPDKGLCCTTTPIWQLPGLSIPQIMLDMNYGCGTTVHPRDLTNHPTVMYVGVGGGMELLQFAYFSRKKGGVIGIDPVPEMIRAALNNIHEAENLNDWFSADFVDLREGDAMNLPLPDNSVDVAAQNCLFNIFEIPELELALGEIFRVLKPHGKFVLSDPITPVELPDHLRNDERLRAMCLSGVQTYQRYIDLIVDAGFGTIEVRTKRPYRLLDRDRYGLESNILLESIEVGAIKDPMPEDGACVFTGRTAIYYGHDEFFDDDNGHILVKNQPAAVCDKTASNLKRLARQDIFITDSTYFYDGGGCC